MAEWRLLFRVRGHKGNAAHHDHSSVASWDTGTERWRGSSLSLVSQLLRRNGHVACNTRSRSEESNALFETETDSFEELRNFSLCSCHGRASRLNASNRKTMSLCSLMPHLPWALERASQLSPPPSSPSPQQSWQLFSHPWFPYHPCRPHLRQQHHLPP